MIRKYVLSALALVGVALGILAAVRSAHTLVPTPMVSEPPAPSYQTFVAGAGLVEANTKTSPSARRSRGLFRKSTCRSEAR